MAPSSTSVEGTSGDSGAPSPRPEFLHHPVETTRFDLQAAAAESYRDFYEELHDLDQLREAAQATSWETLSAAAWRATSWEAREPIQGAATSTANFPSLADRGPEFWAAVWNPPTPPTPYPGAKRRRWRGCECNHFVQLNLPWLEASARGWFCPLWNLTAAVHPTPAGFRSHQISAWAQPRQPEWIWRQVAAHLHTLDIRVLHCTGIPIWAALDLCQRTRRQLAAVAYSFRRPPHHCRTEEDSDSEAEQLRDYYSWPGSDSEISPAGHSD